MEKATKRNCLRWALFLSIPLVFGSCATIISGTKQKITVTGNVTTPVQLLVDGDTYSNVTLPTTVKIKRKNEVSKISALVPDYKLEKQEVSKMFNHTVWANAAGTVLFPVFMYVDWKNGAYKTAEQNNIHLEFTPTNSEEEVFNSFIDFGTEYYAADQLNNALYYYQLAYDIDSVNDIALQKKDEVYDRMFYLEQKARAKEAKTAMWLDILSVTGAALQATGTTIQTAQSLKHGSSGGATSNSNNYSGNSISSNSNKNQSATSSTSTKGSVSEVTNKNTDSNTYSDWETQLIKMNTYPEKYYNDSNRRHIQDQMKQIRQKWEKRGYRVYKSDWEDWDGIIR
ncbi:MAG: hypothetical protein EZS26_000523 [Candidatus Ordinivivax streblomastigis]|uniref:PEGA domain-containing protein n=1 Tax=Candidatus Ordinivivax streblomastigis TaxID=2540710 RepID=A0A5M8P4H7_9BACT|nr:MAG: hypothetical protein EZS26_000444 [Candidatus Ordinivivax streblomastigis]KAA6303363.1 MAG: hypothetical protein EZS26_000523 [Candidatus Ordinivivax streblomastigis]